MTRTFRYRPATPEDADLVFAMLLHAVNWDPGRPPVSPDQVAADAKLSHYAAPWPRPGDLGIVVEDGHGAGKGAAWLRCFTSADPSYGFLDAETPELSIGVDPTCRGQGLGTELCRRLLDAAEARGTHRVCLSVEKANPALALYQRLGFETVRDDGDAVTLLRSSARRRPEQGNR